LITPIEAVPFGKLGTSALLDERLLDYPAAVIHSVGSGKVAYLPFSIFDFFAQVQYPAVRQFVGTLIHELVGVLPIRVTAPTCVDVVLHQKDTRTIAHFINRASGIPNHPHSGAVDEIPRVGPITLEMELPHEPGSVTLAFESGALNWVYEPKSNGDMGGVLSVTLDHLHIHGAIIIE